MFLDNSINIVCLADCGRRKNDEQTLLWAFIQSPSEVIFVHLARSMLDIDRITSNFWHSLEGNIEANYSIISPSAFFRNHFAKGILRSCLNRSLINFWLSKANHLFNLFIVTISTKSFEKRKNFESFFPYLAWIIKITEKHFHRRSEASREH